MTTVPKYQQVAEDLRKDILRGQKQPLDRLPTEHQLCATYDVSRGTIRSALAELTSEGLIRAAQGSGTYVASSSPMTRYFSLSNFDDEMRSLGHHPSTRVLEATMTTAGTHGDRLGVRADAGVMLIKRLRLADDQPVAVEQRVLRAELCPDLLSEDLVHQSLHWLIAVKYAVPLARLEHVVDRQQASEQVADELGLVPGAPVLAIERLTYTENNGDRTPAVWFQSFHREDQPQRRNTL